MSRFWIAGFAGFLALAMEIVWMRLFGLSFHGSSFVMPFVLGSYLLGLAAGVWLYRAQRGKSQSQSVSSWLLCSGAADLLLGLGYLWLDANGSLRTIAGFLVIFISALCKGGILTILADAAPPGQNRGQWAGYVLSANIAGSTLGPLVTCYVLFDWLSWQQTLQCLALSSLVLGLWQRRSERSTANNRWTVYASIGIGALSFIAPTNLLNRILDDGQMGQAAIASVIETRHGVFHRLQDPRGDVILGANLYDGRINLDPLQDLNGISRIYHFGASMQRTERVLVVGLGSGAWLEVIRHFPDVQHIQVVELADAYAQLMQESPLVSGSLRDTRIQFAYTDGRRWLRRHADQQFDLIVLNTTFHWRAFATNLLSQEFFQSLQPHLRPGGSVLLNATESPDVVSTFLSVYPQSVATGGALLGPYKPPIDLIAHRRSRLFAMGDLSARMVAVHGTQAWDALATRDFQPLPSGSGQVITADNMRSEYHEIRPLSIAHFD